MHTETPPVILLLGISMHLCPEKSFGRHSIYKSKDGSFTLGVCLSNEKNLRFRVHTPHCPVLWAETLEELEDSMIKAIQPGLDRKLKHLEKLQQEVSEMHMMVNWKKEKKA